MKTTLIAFLTIASIASLATPVFADRRADVDSNCREVQREVPQLVGGDALHGRAA